MNCDVTSDVNCWIISIIDDCVVLNIDCYFAFSDVVTSFAIVINWLDAENDVNTINDVDNANNVITFWNKKLKVTEDACNVK